MAEPQQVMNNNFSVMGVGLGVVGVVLSITALRYAWATDDKFEARIKFVTDQINEQLVPPLREYQTRLAEIEAEIAKAKRDRDLLFERVFAVRSTLYP